MSSKKLSSAFATSDMEFDPNSIQDIILESQEYIERTAPQLLFNNIGQSFLKNYPPSYDIIHSFEDSIEHIGEIVSTQSVLNDYVYTNVEKIIVKLKYYVDNVRIYSPKTHEHITRSHNFAKASTPNEAMVKRLTYALLLIGDVHFSYTVIDLSDSTKTKSKTIRIADAWVINVPMPVGCKWCTLRQLDPDCLNPSTRSHPNLIKTGEDMEGLYGYFIIGGFLKYLIPYYAKPFNMPIIVKNNYDNQLSRFECLYSSGMDYENSFYIIASMIRPKNNVMKQSGKNSTPVVDYIFSLQMNDPSMNGERIVSRKKVLINAIPIRYLFYAFGCETDEEMIKYICPDLSDEGLINSIKQACLEGEAHISVAMDLIENELSGNSIIIKNLNKENARFIIGSVILNEDFKEKERKKYNYDAKAAERERKHQNKPNVGKTFYRYRRSIIDQTDLLLRTKFMPGIGKLENKDIDLLYEKDPGKLTEEEKHKMAEFELIRDKAICTELGLIVKDLYNIGNDVVPSMDKISLLNRRVRSAHQIEHEFKGFNNARMREIKISIENYLNSLKTIKSFYEDRTINVIINKISDLTKQLSATQSTSMLNSFKGIDGQDRSKMRTNLLTPKNQTFVNAMLREIVISTDTKAETTGVHWEYRVVHPSHLFFVDPVYSPESGAQVGRYQQPTLYTYLTTGSSPKPIVEFIKTFDKFELPSADITKHIQNKYIIKVNGSTIGYVDQYEPLEELYNVLMQARAEGHIIDDCGITVNHQRGILEIWCDEGRLITIFVNPKFAFEITNEAEVRPKDDFLKWINSGAELSYGIRKRYIEKFDPTMTVHNIVVADSLNEYYNYPWKYTHIALPLHTLSFVTCVNPCIQLNAGVRASYCSNHLKQAIGPTLRYPQCKFVNENNVLLTPEIPLVRTAGYDMTQLNEKPTGQNITIAFMVYTDNQEDSFIINKSSLESGLFVIDSVTSYSEEIKKQEESFEVPTGDIIPCGNTESYQKISSKTCIPYSIGEKFWENDPLICKKAIINKKDRTEVDRSVINNKPDGIKTGDYNLRPLRLICKNGHADNNIKLKIVTFGQRRHGIAGDKFNSMHAQKGTIGRIYEPSKMPYTNKGLRPDIIFNPPSIFKRKTIGQIYEPTLGKLCALLGCPIDCTPYATVRTQEEIDNLYKELGLDNLGYEDIYDPDTGMLIGKAFIGVMNYQRQQHLVENKINVRAGEGDIDRITQLPLKGKRKCGGQSLDLQSNFAMYASGVQFILQDYHLNQGAKTIVAFCRTCHKQFTYFDVKKNAWVCSNCGYGTDFCIKEVVPAENLINQIFNSMHIGLEYDDC